MKLALYGCGLAVMCFVVQRLLVGEILTHLGSAEMITILKREWVRNGWVRFPSDKVRVVALGDSRILAAIDPVTMDNVPGADTHTINIAIPASTSLTHAAMLRELLEAGEVPDWILLGISPATARRANLSSYRSLGVKSPWEIWESARTFPEGRKILMDWLLPMRRFQREIVGWLNHLLFDGNALSAKKSDTGNLVQGLKDDRGLYAISKAASLPEESLSRENFLNINAGLDPACREILEIAAGHSINVLVITAPIRPGKLTRSPATESEAVSVGDGLRGIHFSSRFFDPLVLPESDFADNVHLNDHGAAAFSRWLAEEFSKIRQEEAPAGKSEESAR